MSARRSRGKSQGDEQSAKRRRLSPTKKSDDYVYFEDDSMTEEATSEASISDYEDSDVTPRRSSRRSSVSSTASKKKASKTPAQTPKTPAQNPPKKTPASKTPLTRSVLETPEEFSSPSTPGERSKRIRKPVNRGDDFIFYDDKAEGTTLTISNDGVKIVGKRKDEMDDEDEEDPLPHKSGPPKPTPRGKDTKKGTLKPKSLPRLASLSKRERQDIKAAGEEYAWIIQGPKPVVELDQLDPEEIEAILSGAVVEPKRKAEATPVRGRGRPSKPKPKPQPEPKLVKKEKVVRIIKDGKHTVIRPLKEGESANRSPVGKPRASAPVQSTPKMAPPRTATPKAGTPKVPTPKAGTPKLGTTPLARTPTGQFAKKEKATPTSTPVKLPASKTPTTSGKKVAQVTPQPMNIKQLAEADSKKGTESPEKFILTRAPPGVTKGKGSENEQYVLCMNEDGQLMYLPADVVLSNTTGSVRAEVTVPDSSLASNKHHIMIGDASSVKVKVRNEQMVASSGSVKKIVKETIEEAAKVKVKSPSPVKPKTEPVTSPAQAKTDVKKSPQAQAKKSVDSTEKSKLWSSDAELFGSESPMKAAPKEKKVVAEKQKAPMQDFVLCLNKDDGEFVYISRDLLKSCSNLQPVDTKQAITPKKGSIILKQPQKGTSTKILVTPNSKPVKQDVKPAPKAKAPPKPKPKKEETPPPMPEMEEEKAEDSDFGDDDWSFPSPAKSDPDLPDPEFYICEKTGDIISKDGTVIDAAPPPPEIEDVPLEKALDYFGAAKGNVVTEKIPTVSSSLPQMASSIQPVTSTKSHAEALLDSLMTAPATSTVAPEPVPMKTEPVLPVTKTEPAAVTSEPEPMDTSTPDESTMAHNAAVESLMSLQSSAVPQDSTISSSGENLSAASQSLTTEAASEQQKVYYEITLPDGTTTITDTLPSDVTVTPQAPSVPQPPPTSQSSGVIYEITQPDGTTIYTDTIPPELANPPAPEPTPTPPQPEAQPQQQQDIMYEITNPDGTVTYSNTLPEGVQLAPPDEPAPEPQVEAQPVSQAQPQEQADSQEEAGIVVRTPQLTPEPQVQEADPEPEPEPELHIAEPEPQVPEEQKPQVQEPQLEEPSPPKQKMMYQITQPDGSTYLTEVLPEGVTLVGDDGQPLQNNTSQNNTQTPQPEPVTQAPSISQDIIREGVNTSVPAGERLVVQQPKSTTSRSPATLPSISGSKPMGTVMSDEFGAPTRKPQPKPSTSKAPPAIILMKKTPKGMTQQKIILSHGSGKSPAQLPLTGGSKTFVTTPSQKRTVLAPASKSQVQYVIQSPSAGNKQSKGESSSASESAFSILSNLGQTASPPAQPKPSSSAAGSSSSQTKYLVIQTSSGLMHVPVSGNMNLNVTPSRRGASPGGISLLKKTLTEATASPPAQKLIESTAVSKGQSPVTLPMDILQQALSSADIDEEQAKNLSVLYQ